MSTVLIGNWDRPCSKCGQSPADGALFTATKITEKGQYRRGACSDCLNVQAKDYRAAGQFADSWEKAGDWTRPCIKCGREGNSDDFDVGSKRHSKLYRKSYCRVCAAEKSAEHDRANPEQAKAREARRDPRDWPAERIAKWKKDPDKLRRTIKNANIRAKFGISLEDYEFRFELQGGFCTICDREISLSGTGKDKACLDHDHETGELRDFLCPSCNSMIGMAQEDLSILCSAIKYLEVCHRGR